MSQKTCLLLKPHLTDYSDSGRQGEELQKISGILKDADLKLLESDVGVVVTDISVDLIELIYEVDVLVVDVNNYSSSKDAAPFLYYLLAWSHSQADKTILVAKSKNHLPSNLQVSAYTLAYKGDMLAFARKLKRVIKKIVSGNSRRSNNPLQDFLQDLIRTAQEEALELEAEKAANAAKILKLKEQEIAQQKKELEEQKRQLNQAKQQREATIPQRIQFRPVIK